MIHNNFAILLAKKRMRISVVHRETGISRTTLTKLYYDNIQTINLNVIDKLCSFLNCKIEDIFEYKIEEESPKS